MKTTRFTAAAFISVFVLLCPAAFGQDDITTGPRPRWVDRQPADDERNMYFVGFGMSRTSNLKEAQLFATEDITGQIIRFLGVKITSETSTAAVGDLDDFKTSISRQVTESSTARLTGFRVAGKWSEKNSRGVTVFVLVRYEKEALLKEKKRLEEIFQSQIDAVRVPETEGEKLVSTGAYYEAVLKFIEAAVAASESSLEDSDVALNRTLARAMDTLEKITLHKLSDNLSGTAGESPAEALRLKVAAGPSSSSPGVPRAAVRITYYESRRGSRLNAKTTVVQSDAQGSIAFTHPVLTFVGKGKVVMALDLAAYLDKLKQAERKAGDKVRALRRLALSKKQEFSLTSLSQARNVPLAVFVVDMDDNGRPLDRHQSTAGGIIESLSEQGFTLRTAALDPSLAAGTSESELIRLVQGKAPGMVRAVVGTASVDNSFKDQGRFIVRAVANVKVVDLKEKKVLFQKQLKKSYTGATLDAARTAAFKQLGRDMGLRIATEMQ